MLNEQDRAIIHQGNWFNSCGNCLQHDLLSHAKIVELNSGESLFLRGDNNCGVYCVIVAKSAVIIFVFRRSCSVIGTAKGLIALHYQRIDILDKYARENSLSNL